MVLIAAFAALLAASSVPANAAGAQTVGRWSIVQRTDDQSVVQLRFDYNESSERGNWNSSWSSSVPLADAGIPADRLRGPIAPVAFAITREPGTFSCTGSAGENSGAGQFTYTASSRFDDALASRGLGRPDARQSLQLAIAGVTLAFVDQLRSSSRNAKLDDLVRVVQHGVSPRYINELAALGYKVDSIDELVRMIDHGVSANYVRALQAAGYRNLSTDDLVRLSDHGVTLPYVAAMRAAGYKNLAIDELIALRDHGVSVAFVDRLKAHGYTNLSVRDLIRLRDSGI